MRTIFFIAILAAGLRAEIHEHPGSKDALPHDKYIHAVSQSDSPVQQIYVKGKDGLYIAAAMRKPKGNGPFPALVYFHGAPGGRGMEKLVEWSSGSTGSPVFERFLKEGYVVVVSDYRGGLNMSGMVRPIAKEQITYVDDGLAMVDYVRSLPYVDPANISVYGVSLGGNLVLHLVGRTNLHAAIVGAPAAMSFLGVALPPAPPGGDPNDRWKNVKVDSEIATRNIEPIRTPILILVGTADGLIHVDRPLHDLLAKAGKLVRMDIYANGYHDFCIGPQAHPGRAEPLLDSTLDALEKSVQFLKGQFN
jgi:dipeptidyl aminopeptidase/acylaminoacyl peptidase